MTRRERLRNGLPLALLGPLLLLAACVSGGAPPGPHPTAPIGGGPPSAVTMASFNFTESKVLAEVYGQALRGAGYRVEMLQGLGPRELLDPALARGLIDFVPEYAGSALQFLTAGRERPTSRVVATHRALERALEPHGLEALAAAPAQDTNAIVVTGDTATRYGLRTISDLTSVAPQLRFGGPRECPHREFCLLGLRRTYGLHFKPPFYGLDSGGPLTLQALRAGQIDVALLFSTDPGIERYRLVALVDDRSLQPAENVTPVVTKELVARYGQSLERVVDEVSGRLTADELRSLNGRATQPGASLNLIAAQWLADQGIA